MKALVKVPWARNLWAIMKEFKVLPTDKRFQELSNTQMQFILYNMDRDNWEAEQASKGRLGNIVEDDDTTWYDTPTEDFDPVPDFLDAEDLAEQAYNRLSESEREKMDARLESEKDGDEEEELIHQNKMAMIQQNLKELDESLNNTTDDNNELSKEDISNAMNEFDDDDWYM